MKKLQEVLRFDLTSWVAFEMSWYGEKLAQIIARPFLQGNKFLQFLIK